MNNQYNEVTMVVDVQTIYVIIFALGFLFHKSIIVGIKPKKVITHQAP
jgi:hypothetical protein